MDIRYVLGVDSGGSHTRVLCADLDGHVLATARAGGGSPTHNADSKDQVQRALHDVIDLAGVRASDAVGLASGMAGLNSERDRSWADGYFDLDGLDCPRHLVNDSEVAHAGAFAGGPGIMVIAGTGSIILGITESGEQVRNDRYFHYAGGARHLAFDAMARILIDEDTEADAEFVRAVLAFWDVADKAGLRERIREHESADRNDVKRHYGRIAPLVTGAADSSPLASAACEQLARATCVGVRLLAAHFESAAVPVALHGGVAGSAAFTDRFATALTASVRPRLKLVDAVLGPTAGAALLALQRAGVEVDGRVVERLAAGARVLG